MILRKTAHIYNAYM